MLEYLKMQKSILDSSNIITNINKLMSDGQWRTDQSISEDRTEIPTLTITEKIS